MTSADDLEDLVEAVIDREHEAVQRYMDGDRRDPMGYLVGQVVQESGFHANPAEARAVLKRHLHGVPVRSDGAGS